MGVSFSNSAHDLRMRKKLFRRPWLNWNCNDRYFSLACPHRRTPFFLRLASFFEPPLSLLVPTMAPNLPTEPPSLSAAPASVSSTPTATLAGSQVPPLPAASSSAPASGNVGTVPAASIVAPAAAALETEVAAAAVAEGEEQIAEATVAASASTVIKGPSPSSATLPASPAAAMAWREGFIHGTAPKTVAPALESAPVEEQVAPEMVIDREPDHSLATAAMAKSVVTPRQSPPRSRPAFEPVSRQSSGAAPGSSSRRGAQPNAGSPAASHWNRMFGQTHVDGVPLSKYDQLSPLTYMWLEQP